MPNGTIRDIYRYPVKGLSPERLARTGLKVGETLPNDRRYAIENGPSGFDPAAPGYLARYGLPRTPADLARHRSHGNAYLATRDTWRFTDARGAVHEVRIAGPLESNNGGFNASIARAGMGIALEPDFIVGEDIRAGALVRILPAYAPPSSLIYAVYPSRRHLSAKVRAFVDFLALRFAKEAPWRLRPSRTSRTRRT